MIQEENHNPSYIRLFRSGELKKRIHQTKEILSSCILCPRRCKVDRLTGERGFCKSGYLSSVAHFLPHFGEEPPLSGTKGAGTIFFSNCNLSCLFCQNYQISQLGIGNEMSAQELADMMLKLQTDGCHNIEFVSTTPHLHAVLHALEIAIQNGLRIPLVYNTNGYESLEGLAMLDGVIDIYLPDFKYADAELGERFSAVRDYRKHALPAIKEMQRQVGKLVIANGVAARGLIIRHLILPSYMSNTFGVLSLIAKEISSDVQLSLMSQYNPMYGAAEHKEINRKLTQEEYDLCIRKAEALGFENVWLQELGSADELIPDFTMRDPFNFKQT